MDITQVLAAHGLGSGIMPEGTAVAADVLETKTFINKDGGPIAGTMKNNGVTSIPPGPVDIMLTAGYFAAGSKVLAVTNLTGPNIKAGVTVGGVVGSFTSDANAVAADILASKTVYVNGNKITGTMASRPFITSPVSLAANTGILYVRINPGAYVDNQVRDGALISEIMINEPNFHPDSLLNDRTYFGMRGNIVAKSQDSPTAGYFPYGTGRLFYTLSPGYYGQYSSNVYSEDPNYVPSNIRSGVSVFGLGGTLIEGRRVASGPGTCTRNNSGGQPNAYCVTVGGGLNFRASKVYGVITSNLLNQTPIPFFCDFDANLASTSEHTSANGFTFTRFTIDYAGGYSNFGNFKAPVFYSGYPAQIGSSLALTWYAVE